MPCPDGRNDDTVRLSQGDLMLCRQCEEFRFPSTKRTTTTATKKKEAKMTTAAAGRLDAGRRIASTSSVTDQPTTDDDITAASTAPHVINELLTYIGYYRSRSNGDALRRVVLSYYTPADISDAKKTVADLFRSTFVGTVMATDRRNSTVRSAHEAELDDVIAMLDLLDEKQLLSSTLFVAANLEHLPKYGPEEVNICTVVDNHLKLSLNVDKLSAELDHLKSSNAISASGHDNNDIACIVDTALTNFQQRIEQLQASVNSRIDHMNSVLSKFSKSVATTTCNC